MTDYGLSLKENRRLGKLCPYGHDWNGTGRSLRYRSTSMCIECMRVKSLKSVRVPFAVRRALLPGKWYSQSDLDRFWARVTKGDGCWTASGWTVEDYPMIWMQGRDHRMSRLSWEFHFGPVPEGLFVCHHCDNPQCIRPDHLFVGTQADNVRDRDRKGRTARGERSGAVLHPELLPRGVRHHRARLTDSDVIAMCRMWQDGRRLIEVAAAFGVSKSCVWAVVTGLTWGHVQLPSDVSRDPSRSPQALRLETLASRQTP